MKRKTGFIVTLAVVAALAGLGLYGLSRTPFEEQAPAVGQSAPRISLADLSGRMVRLSDYEDHVVLVFFWASWCGPCKDYLDTLETLYRELGGKGFTVLAVATDPIPEDFALRRGLSFPVLVANDRVRREFGNIHSVPASFLLDRDRRIVEKHRRYERLDRLRGKIETLLSS